MQQPTTKIRQSQAMKASAKKQLSAIELTGVYLEKEAAALMKISRSLLTRIRQRGEIRCIQLTQGGHYRYTGEMLLEYLISKEVK